MWISSLFYFFIYSYFLGGFGRGGGLYVVVGLWGLSLRSIFYSFSSVWGVGSLLFILFYVYLFCLPVFRLSLSLSFSSCGTVFIILVRQVALWLEPVGYLLVVCVLTLFCYFRAVVCVFV